MASSADPVEGLYQLLPVINKLQDVFAKVNMTEEINLPQIVVVGAQSTGKSSVLENVVGKAFLPRGTGIVTRRPLVLQMSHMSDDEFRARQHAGKPLEEAVFLHKPDTVFTDFDEVRREIEAETDRKCGTRKGVHHEPIRLRVTSSHVLDLTVVDLPGLTKIAVEGQDSMVGAAIEDMVLKWIRPENAIILAVTAANTDIANSDALQLARRVDPQGNRTIGVLTKIDLMDDGTDCVDVLTGKVVRLKKGFVGLVNRSQRDIENKKDIRAALEGERQFFSSHPSYSKYKAQLGTPFLTRTLSHQLLVHIRDCLPQLRQNVVTLLDQTKALLEEYSDGDDMGPKSTLLTLLRKYSANITRQLDGDTEDETRSKGARIKELFRYGFAPHVQRMDPVREYTDAQIQTIVSSCQGTRNRLFVPEQAFYSLVRRCIRTLVSPSCRCVEYVQNEVMNLVRESSSCLERYPRLQEGVIDHMSIFVDRHVDALTAFIQELISMEAAQINTLHPDFYNGGSIDELIASWTESSTEREEGQEDPEMPPEVQHPDMNDSAAAVPVDERVVRETDLMRDLTTTYFSIVKKHLVDHVPKAVVCFLVNKLKEETHNELVATFYNESKLDELLEESEEAVRKRKALKGMADCLSDAVDTLNWIRDFKV